jgi:uncharacterized delta-60 repeat protein
MMGVTLAHSSARAEIGLARLTTAGVTDTTFGTAGRTVSGIPGEYGNDVAIDPSTGKIVVVGKHLYSILVTRFTANGLPDTTFANGSATWIINYPDESNSEGTAVKIDSSGRIVIAAEHNGHMSVTRLLSNGDFDTTFGSGGGTVTSYSPPCKLRPTDIEFDSNGKIMVGAYLINGCNEFIVARYTSGGSLDTSFSGDGISDPIFDVTKTSKSTGGIAIGPNGKIVAAGWVRGNSANSGETFGVMRFTSSGSLDTTFDSDGKDIIDFSSCEAELGWSVQVNASNQIVIGGTASCNEVQYFALSRSTVSGPLDTGFDQDGKILTTAWQGASAFSIVLDGNKVVATGTARVAGAPSRIMVARYTSAGALDTSFDDDGWRTVAFPNLSADGMKVVLDSSGRILLLGQVQ